MRPESPVTGLLACGVIVYGIGLLSFRCLVAGVGWIRLGSLSCPELLIDSDSTMHLYDDIYGSFMTALMSLYRDA